MRKMASSSALAVRNEFPALLADPDAIYADGATGTQVSQMGSLMTALRCQVEKG